MNKSNGKRGGRREGAGAKKDHARARLGRNLNLTAQGMPRNVAEQIVQSLLVGDRRNAAGLIDNLISRERRDEALRLAEECARLVRPFPELWGGVAGGKIDLVVYPSGPTKERLEATRAAEALLRRISDLADRQRTATVVNLAFAGQTLKPRGTVIMSEDPRLAAINRTKKTAEEERAYWKLVFELARRQRDDPSSVTREDMRELEAVTPEDLRPPPEARRKKTGGSDGSKGSANKA